MSSHVDVSEVVAKHEKCLFGKKYLYVPLEGSDQLLVLLSAHNQKGKYFLLRSFLENQKYNLLFITDQFNTWYLDDDFGGTYKNIISTVIEKFSRKNVYVFGSSMAGYGAIHFALHFKVNCLACNPQVNLEVSMDYSWHELSMNMGKLVLPRKTVPLDRLYDITYYDGVMCIVHGHAPIDVANVELILGSSSPVRKLIIYTIDSDDHAMPFGREVGKVYQLLDVMGLYEKFDLNYEDQNGQFEVMRFNRKLNVQRNSFERHRVLSRKQSGASMILWSRRHEITHPGLCEFTDVGFYNSKGNLSGALSYFDGDKHSVIYPKIDSLPVKYCSPLAAVYKEIYSDKDYIYNDCWVRVSGGAALGMDGNEIIVAKMGDSKNCYMNFVVPVDFVSNVRDGQYITCLLDVDVSCGQMTFSVGGVGDSGYYQANKTIDSSGVYVLSVSMASINRTHKDAVFARVYPFPDGADKSFKVNKLNVFSGLLPFVGSM